MYKYDEVVELAKIAWPVRMIRLETGLSKRRIYELMTIARSNGHVFPKPKTYGRDGGITMTVNDDLLRRVMNFSKATHIPPRDLAEQILERALKSPEFALTAVFEGES
ncbi:MAG: hypothetical protein ACSHWY_01190 [Octadecabacter sp.]